MSTATFLLTVIPLIILGVILVQLIVELRWIDRLSWLARPLMRLGHLHPECAGSFLVAAIFPTAGHSMLARYHSEKRISRPELIISAIMNALPGYVAQGRSILPVTMPLIGVFGLIYYGLVLLADLIKTLILLTILRRFREIVHLCSDKVVPTKNAIVSSIIHAEGVRNRWRAPNWR